MLKQQRRSMVVESKDKKTMVAAPEDIEQPSEYSPNLRIHNNNNKKFEDEPQSLLSQDDGVGVGVVRPRRSLLHLMGINSFAFVYGILISTFGLIVLPLESEALWPEAQEALLLSIFLALCGVSQLSGPLAGYASDCCQSKWGRRRPYLLGGACVTIPCLLLLHEASQTKNFGLYLPIFFIAMLALNVMFTSYQGALTDLIPSEQRGLANGMMGAFTVLGASIGFGCFSNFLTLHEAYIFYSICVATAVLISMVAYTEEPYVVGPTTTIASSSSSSFFAWKEIARCYWIDRIEHYDFYLVFCSRTLYYMGVSAQTFMMFYFRDIIQNSQDTQADVSYLALIGQLSGAVVCLPMGLLSQRVGRKPLIALSSIVIVGSYIGFMACRDRYLALTLGAIYGIGNGSYLSVDYALACDVLPDSDQAARYLGIWGVGAFIGTLLGPLLMGPALVLFGTPTTTITTTTVVTTLDDVVVMYEPLGYIVTLIIGSICITLNAVVVSFVRGAK